MRIASIKKRGVTELKKKIDILLDPIANQIIQKLRINGSMTTNELLQSGIKTSRATLYRKLERMLEENIICIAETQFIMGQEEKKYKIKDIYITNQTDNEERMKTVTMGLMNIAYQYEQYFQDENADVDRDKLFMMNYNIALSDTDYRLMLQEILSVIDRYQSCKSDTAKNRNLYFLSAPGEII